MQWNDSGSEFEGEFVEGLRQGTGTYTYSDGSFYKGEYHKGLRNGFGVF